MAVGSDGSRFAVRVGARLVLYISESEELAAFCERIGSSRVIAVDTEFVRERTYYPRLCLVQVAIHDEAASIDPILVGDLSPLVALLEDPSITKVFHACVQDLEVLQGTLGCTVSPIFDTQLAAAFLGSRLQIGLAALVKDFCGVTLAKGESLTDWERRPLSADQLRYAEEDVVYLPSVYDRMVQDLSRLGRLGWMQPELELLVAQGEREAPENAYVHLKRVSTLTRRQLAIAREVCAWREREAARRDQPRRWVVNDEVIVEVCRMQPRNVRRLRTIRGTDQLSEKSCREVLEAIERGRACPAEQCPHADRHARPSVETQSVLDLMNALLRLVAESEGIAPQLIATRDDLHDFLMSHKHGRLREGWRYEICGRQMQALLSGELGLTVRKGRLELV